MAHVNRAKVATNVGVADVEAAAVDAIAKIVDHGPLRRWVLRRLKSLSLTQRPRHTATSLALTPLLHLLALLLRRPHRHRRQTATALV